MFIHQAKYFFLTLFAFTTGSFMSAQVTPAPTMGYEGPKENFHIYVLAGNASIGSAAELSDGKSPIVPRCFFLNEKGKWQPARGKLPQASASKGTLGTPGPGIGLSFAKAMLGKDENVSIGLVCCTAPGTKIEDWHRKSSYFRQVRKGMKTAEKKGVLKGLLWRHGASIRGSAVDHLKDLFAFIRTAAECLNLPIVGGELPGNPSMNAQLTALATDVHAVGVADVTGLGHKDDDHLDAAGLDTLGQHYAEQMVKVQTQWAEKEKSFSQAPMTIFDAHIHGASNNKDGLDIVAKWMEHNHIEGCVSHDLLPTRAADEKQRQIVKENFAKYKEKILHFCFIEPDEVSTVDEAVKILEREKAVGAVGFGEHYGRNLMFDDPRNLRLYAACEKVGFPVMFHIDRNKNMVEKRMRRVEHVLKMFPDCIIIAHAEWWAYFPDGTCDRMLRKYPNLYADTSGSQMLSLLNRDRTYTREFMIRNADKVLYGSDFGWWNINGKSRDSLGLQLINELDLPEDVKTKILRGNAERIFGFKSKKK